MAVNFKHSKTGLIKEAPEGFSWTTFFFPVIVPMVRGMWGAAAITWITMGFAGLYYMFAINKLYAETLIEKGYEPASEIDHSKLAAMGIVLDGHQEKEVPKKKLQAA